jgi:hypothetical protein
MSSLGLGLSLSNRQIPLFSGLLGEFPGAAAAYSLRRLGAYGGPVVEVRSSAGGSPQDFTANQITNGDLVAFVGGGNDGFVSTWYDQSGEGNDATQITTTMQPKIVDAGALVVGGLDFDGVDDFLTLPSLQLGSGPRSSFLVSRPSVTTFADTFFGTTDSGSTGTGWRITPEIAIRLNVSTWLSTTSCSTIADNLLTTIYSTGNVHAGTTMFLNGTSVTRTGGTDGAVNTGDAPINIGADRLGLNTLDGTFAELIIYKSDESANRVGIETNIQVAHPTIP